MGTVNKNHPYILKIILICYLCIGMAFYLKAILLFLVLYIILGISMLYYERLQNIRLSYLITQVQSILDQKTPTAVIDGEGKISFLSSQIYLLHQRYYALLEKMEKEKVKLKEYIEDISHQLKTPITSMRINEELLLESDLDDHKKEKIKHIYQQTLKMSQLVSDLLTLALIDSHSIVFDFKHYSTEDILMRVEEDLESLMIKHHSHIQYIGEHQDILCDKKWMVEALENIIKNCIERSQNITIHIEKQTQYTKIIISDNGEGISQEDLPHIFERFYRGKNNQGEGIGIGLCLAYEIVSLHHGFIHASHHNGAVFEIALPHIDTKKKL